MNLFILDNFHYLMCIACLCSLQVLCCGKVFPFKVIQQEWCFSSASRQLPFPGLGAGEPSWHVASPFSQGNVLWIILSKCLRNSLQLILFFLGKLFLYLHWSVAGKVCQSWQAVFHKVQLRTGHHLYILESIGFSYFVSSLKFSILFSSSSMTWQAGTKLPL